MKSQTSIGQAGEWIAAAALIELGVQVMVSPTIGCDLLAYCGKHFWRIEVKSTKKPEAGKDKVYRFNTTRGSAQKAALDQTECDIVALVSIERRRVFFRHVNTITSKSTRLSVNRFIEGCERESWKESTKWK